MTDTIETFPTYKHCTYQSQLHVFSCCSRRSLPPTEPSSFISRRTQISDLFVRYREDLLPVLKGVNISIEGGSRVGVVGRTGAGKSSFVAAMFRLVERDQDRQATARGD